jgi:hypothetical protein
MEPTCSFETSVDFKRTKRQYIPEDSILTLLPRSQEPTNGRYSEFDETSGKELNTFFFKFKFFYLLRLNLSSYSFSTNF